MDSSYFNLFIKNSKKRSFKKENGDQYVTIKKLEFWIRALQNTPIYPYPMNYYKSVLCLMSAKAQKEFINDVFKSYFEDNPSEVKEKICLNEFYKEKGCLINTKSKEISICDYSLVASFLYTHNSSMISKKFYNVLLKDFSIRQKNLNENDDYLKRFQILQNEMNLNEMELNLVSYLWFMNNNALCNIEDGYNEINDYRKNDKSKIRLFKHIFEPTSDEFEYISNNNSRLKKLDIITHDCQLSLITDRFLNGISDVDLSTDFFTIDQGPTIPLDYFLKNRNDILFALELLQKNDDNHSLNILFYGTEGTGKTELSRALAKELHWPLVMIHLSNNSDVFMGSRNSSERFKGITFADYKFKNKKALFLVDEADAILNQSEKGFLNLFMEKIKHPVIWITNSIRLIEKSTSRRFDFSIKFDTIQQKQRIEVWKSILKEHKAVDLISEKVIQEFAKKTEMTAGGITQAIVQAKHLQEKGSSFTPETVIHQVINAQSKLVNLRFLSTKNKASSKKYDLSLLNIKGNLPLAIKSIKGFNQCWEKMKKEDSPQSLNILLYGPPGTGKSEFARYVSRLLDRPIITKEASTLLNNFLGETEKNIKKAFEEAEESGSILFFDEVDSFLSNRSTAEKHWEITQVNELLMCMENFKGIFIAATNFDEHLDTACRRRFPFKIGFDYLKSESIKKIWEIYFPKFNFPDKAAKLKGLAPGDFNAVYNNIRYLTQASLSSEYILETLEKEIQFKPPTFQERKMGF